MDGTDSVDKIDKIDGIDGIDGGLRDRMGGFRQPKRLVTLLPFDSVKNAINPKAGILETSKQISDRFPFTISADRTEIHFTLNQNKIIGASLKE